MISTLKYVSRMKPEFRLSELRDYLQEDRSTGEIYQTIESQLYDLGLRATKEGEDYIVARLPRAKPVVLSRDESERMATFFSASRVPRKLERLIDSYVEMKTGRRLGDSSVLEKIRNAIVAQKEQYWKEGQPRKIDYSTGSSVLAYLGYQFPVYFMQFEHIMNDLAAGGLLKDRMKVLDAGTGPGVVPLAVADYISRLDNVTVDISAIEKFDQNIEAYMAIVPGYAAIKGKANIRKPIKSDLMNKPEIPDNIDLMIFSNVINEIEVSLDKKVAMLRGMAEHLAPDGSMIIIEPADKENSMRMRRLVHRLTEKDLNVYSPCSFIWCTRCHPDKCWSFEAKEDIKPTGFMEMLANTEEPYRYLNTDIKFSYAVLRKDGLTRTQYRVPQKAKFARLSLVGRHVEKRINVVASVMSSDLGDKKTHVFKICDGTPSKAVYAILAAHNANSENNTLLTAKYGEVLIFENVLVRYNKENDAYNLLVSKATIVERAGEEKEN